MIHQYSNYIIVLTLTPNVTNITVYEGDYSGICVKADQVARDGPALFYVAFDDYTSDSMYIIIY